jgi:hypothetical protein
MTTGFLRNARRRRPMEPNERLLTYINEALNNGPFVPAEEAERIIDRWTTEDPATLHAWYRQQRVAFVRRALQDALDKCRPTVCSGSAKRRFIDAAETPGPSVLVRWRCKVDDEGTQLSIGAMHAKDHNFVAAARGDQAHALAMVAAFHRAVASRIANKRTDQVFDAETLLALYKSINSSEPKELQAA